MCLSLTSVYLQDNNMMLCRAQKDPGHRNPRCQQKERQICGRNAVHTTPTTSTQGRHHLHVITFTPSEPELGCSQSSRYHQRCVRRILSTMPHQRTVSFQFAFQIILALICVLDFVSHSSSEVVLMTEHTAHFQIFFTFPE